MADRNSKVKGISYAGLHMYIQKKLGKPDRCDICGSTDEKEKYEWANKDHKYKKSLSDWFRACKKCHQQYDMINNAPKKVEKIKTICKTCGREMEIKNTQKRKKMCTECAYDLKKARSSERYWSKKAPNSTRHKYWKSRLDYMEESLK